MKQLTKEFLYLLIEVYPQAKNAGAWKRGVKNYALSLLDTLPSNYTWLDVQGCALAQAWYLISQAICEYRASFTDF